MVAYDVATANMGPNGEGRIYADTWLKIIIGFQDDFGGHDAASENLLLVINVINKAVERAHTLE